MITIRYINLEETKKSKTIFFKSIEINKLFFIVKPVDFNKTSQDIPACSYKTATNPLVSRKFSLDSAIKLNVCVEWRDFVTSF